MNGESPAYSTIGVGGRRLRIGDWNAGATGRLPLLLLNGIGINMELIEPLAQSLGDRRVVSFDMPGVGKSPDPIFPYTMPMMALTTSAVLDHLGITQADVLGISWGGALAQQFAFQHRSRIGKLVLAATSAGSAMVPGNPKMLSHLADPREYTVLRTLRRNLAMLYAGGGNGESFSINAITAPTPFGWACQVGAFAGWTSLPFLPLLNLPVMVMADNDDQIVPPANAQVLRHAIPGAKFAGFRGGGHLFMLTQQERFVAVLRRFLDPQPTVAAA